MFRRQLTALAIIVGLILLNRWIFAALFDLDYLRWYINNGTLIGAGITFISLAATDFKKDVEAISADPLTYCMAYISYIGVVSYSLGTQMRPDRSQWVKLDAYSSPPGQESNSEAGEDDRAVVTATPKSNAAAGCSSILDNYLTLIWLLPIVAGIFLWVVVVMPLQYFVYLLCGAPARALSTSNRRVIVKREPRSFKIDSLGKSEKIPPGWKDASISEAPVTFASLLGALLFFVLGPLLG